jgi:hypothetical protein
VVFIPGIVTAPHGDEEAALILTGLIFGPVIGGITGYILSSEEYVIQEIPPDYNLSILKQLSRYPDKEPEYLREIK